MVKLSSRAAQLLAAARHTEVDRDPAAIAEKLRAVGRPAWPAVVAFEQAYGGLWWPAGDDRDQLGIYYEEPMEDGGDPLALDVTQVPIGSVGVLGLFMNEAGVVTVQPYARSASIEVFLERLALRREPSATTVRVEPPGGDRLAAALGLTPIPEATDRYQAWWEGPGIVMRHEHPPEPGYPLSSESRQDAIFAGSREVAERVAESARALGAVATID